MNFIEKRMEQRGQGGFTLIELLVTIAILAILAGVVLFAIGSSRDNAARASCDTERATIITAAAARDMNETAYAGTGGTIESYLDSAPQYFTVTGDTVTRTNTAQVSTALCDYP